MLYRWNWSSLEGVARWLSALLPTPCAILRSNIQVKRWFKIIITRWQAFFFFWAWTMETACEFRINKFYHLHLGEDPSIPGNVLPCSPTWTKLWGDSQKPSSHLLGIQVDLERVATADSRSCVQKAESPGYLVTWPWVGTFTCMLDLLWAPLSVVLSYYNIKYFHGFAQCQRESVALRNKSLIAFPW